MINAVEHADKLEKLQKNALKDLKEIKASLEAVKPPHPWQAHFSEKYGRVYYYHPETKQSLWEFPRDSDSRSDSTAVDPAAGGGAAQGPRGNTAEGPAVEDGLLQKGLAYVKRREDMRRKQEEELKAEMTGKPQITKYASALAANRDASETIADRSAVSLKIKREKEEQQRRQREQQEQRENSGRPAITRKSQKLTRNVEDMLSWEEQRRARIEAQKSELERRKESEVTAAPVIATSKAVTEKLLKNRNSKFGEGVPIEERLQQYEEIRQFKLQQAAERADRDARRAANPTMVTGRAPRARPSPRQAPAAAQESSGSRNNRWAQQEEDYPEEEEDYPEEEEDYPEEEEESWSDEKEYALYLENMNRLQQLEAAERNTPSGPRAVSFSQSTNIRYGDRGGVHSNSNSSSNGGSYRVDREEAPSVAEAAGERMHREAERAQQRAAEVLQRQAASMNYGADGKPLFQPHLNPTSVKIAERSRGQNLPVEELLFRKGQEREERIKRRQEKKVLEQKAQSNAPKINPVSEKIVREKELLEGRAGESRIERLSRPIGSVKRTVLEGIEQPTFAPKISKKSAQLATQGHYYAAGRAARSRSADRSRPTSSGGHYGHNDHVNSDVDGFMHSAAPESAEWGAAPDSYLSDGGLRDPDDRGQGGSGLYERANTWARERELKIERDRLAREREQMRDCTFRPQLQKAPSQDGLVRGRDATRGRGGHRERSGSTHSGREHRDSSSDSEFRRRGGDDYSARQESWARKRDMKLAIERRRKEKEELESCSFAPNLNHQSNKESQKSKPSGHAPVQPPAQKVGKIPLPPRSSHNQSIDSIPAQGGFSYDTPYVDSGAYTGYIDNVHAPSYGEEYVGSSYGAATRLDFGADEEAENPSTHYPVAPSASYAAPFILGGSNTMNSAAFDEQSYDNMINSPPPTTYPSNGYSFEGNGDPDAFEDDDEYGTEFELDESGAVINTGSFQRYH